MVELKSNPMAQTASETPPPPEKEYTCRLATDAEGNHGYEIGYWPRNADLNDPRHFVVVEKAYGQQEAFARANALNLGADPFVEPEPHAPAADEEEEEDADERAARARRAAHGPIRHRSPSR